jgi:membrane protein YdbS with pleckstrin-like domain
MLNALKSIMDFFGTILDMVKYLVTGLVQLFLLIPQAFAMLTYSIGFLPSVLLAFAAVAITLSIIYLIVGR